MLTPHDQKIVESLLDAYRSGAFPMADPDTGKLDLYAAPQRGVFSLTPGSFHVPRRLRQRLKTSPFHITTDTNFELVIRNCAQPRSEDNGVWISEQLIDLYQLLHKAGHAHSVEAYSVNPDTDKITLAGGIFGIHIGGAFLGESMFHAPPPTGTDASKVCLVHLVAHLRKQGFALFDTQMTNPFLEQFGNTEIPQENYESQLEQALEMITPWDPFEPNWRNAL